MHISLLTIASLAGLASARAQPGPPVGDVSSLIANNGTSVGYEKVVGGVTYYISEPSRSAPKTDKAILYLTDVFGIQLAENRLLADSFARAGFLTVAPDLFNGTPAPADLNAPGFNSSAFLALHGPDVTDPLIENAITYIRGTLKATNLAVTGYCFGGRYSFRFVDAARAIKADVGFAAHPSLLTAPEIAAVGAPISVAAGDLDTLFPAAARNQAAAILQNTTQPYSIDLYSGAPHGFGVRANVSDPQQLFAKESAFLQAVRWFNNW